MSTRLLTRRFAPVLVCLASMTAQPAHAVSKDMIQLQTQVQQLIDSLARMQQSNDQQMGVLKDLVQQDVDAVNKMSTVVSGLQQKLQTQGEAQSQKSDQISGQVQALNDSLDELKARMQRMEKTLTDLQNQAQSTNAALSNLPAANGAPSGSNAPASAPATPSAPQANPGQGAGTTDLSPSPGGMATQPAPVAGGGGPAATEMYRTAYSDYMSGKYPLANSEFGDLIKAHPDDNLAGNALFYTGEIARRADKPTVAIKDYDQVLERYPDNAKVPAAHLHKGEALLAEKQTDAGVRELRALIQRFPNSPEATQAHARLAALGASASARQSR